MSVSYTQEQKKQAIKDGRRLVTLAAGGMVFQDSVSEEENDKIVQYILDLKKRLREEEKTTC